MYRGVVAYALRVGLLIAFAVGVSACDGDGGRAQGDANKVDKVSSAGRATEILRVRNSTAMAVGAGSLWMANADYGTITEVDLPESKVEAVIEVNSNPKSAPGESDPQSVAASGDQIWFTDRARKAVSRIDPETNRIVERIPVGIAAYDIAIDGDTLWVTDLERGVVVLVDASTNRVVERIDVPAAAGISVGSGSVWVVEFGAFLDKPSKLARIDPQTNEVVKEIPIASTNPQDIAYGAGGAWIANGCCVPHSLSVSHVDPNTNKEVATIDTGLETYGVAVASGSVWATGSKVNCPSCGALMRIDPATDKIVGKTNVRGASGVAATDDAVWVSSYFEKGEGLNLQGKATGAVTRVEPAR